MPQRPASTRVDLNATLRDAAEAHRRGELIAARAGYEAVLKVSPDQFDALHLIGDVMRRQGDPASAVTPIRRAIELRPDAPAAHNHLGLALRDLARLDDAIDAFRASVHADPMHAASWNNLGMSLRERGDPESALDCFDRALGAGGEQAGVRLNRANALRDLGRSESALADCERAIAQAPGWPDAWRTRGIVLRTLGLAEAAVACHDAALALRPADPDSLIARGLALADLHSAGAATASIEQAIALAPESADAHWALSRVRLTVGDYGRGLEEFEWRWRTSQGRPYTRGFDSPQWDGSASVEGRTVLLHAEQGLGDTLQFVRYAPLVRARGARLVLEVQPALAALLSRQDLADTVLARGAPLPAFDFHSPLMSLPRAFGTRLDSIPAPRRYLEARPELVEGWRVRLGQPKRPRVGLIWSGAPSRLGGAERSVPLDTLVAVLDEEFEWIALQHEVRHTDRAALESRPQIRWFGEELRDFEAAAAAMEAVDAVVGVDTGPVHLAMALGRPTVLLLPDRADWRWLEERDNSPWYPTAVLVRQHYPDRWDDALRRARRILHERLLQPG